MRGHPQQQSVPALWSLAESTRLYFAMSLSHPFDSCILNVAHRAEPHHQELNGNLLIRLYVCLHQSKWRQAPPASGQAGRLGDDRRYRFLVAERKFSGSLGRMERTVQYGMNSPRSVSSKTRLVRCCAGGTIPGHDGGYIHSATGSCRTSQANRSYSGTITSDHKPSYNTWADRGSVC